MLLLTKLRQPRVFMMKWGLRGPRVILLFTILCFVVFMLYVFVRARFFHGLFRDVDVIAVTNHGEFYCNKPGSVAGGEGQLRFFKGSKRSYKLQQVHIVIRHGDRSPILLNTLPNSPPVKVSCKFNKSWTFYDDLVRIKKGASQFRVSGSKIFPILEERDVCLGGQLTPIGFSQHLKNGEFLQRQYGDFLNTIAEPEEVLTMSTAYSRTVQSAASLLLGMFGDRFSDQKVEIRVQSDKYPETHFLKDEQNNHIYCPALAQKLKDTWKNDELHELRRKIDPIRDQFSNIFDSHLGEIPSLSRIIDILYVTMCHKQLFPKGRKGEVSHKLAKRSFELADTFLSVTHMQVAELQTLSILSQIVHNTAKRIKYQPNKNKNGQKLLIFSAHDTVITPVLQMLGVNDWKWPPYASRIIFEVWKDSEEKSQGTTGADQLSVFKNYFIRVLYNGDDITTKVKFCREKIIDSQLCPLTAFVKYVADEQFEGENYFERIKNLCVGTDL